MVGNPVQAARVYNSRGVDELVFLDIFASEQKRKINLKMVGEVIKECYMPVAIGGGIETIDDINDLLKIGADKVVIKTKALKDAAFIKQAVAFFGSQCITIAVDVERRNENYMIHNKLGIERSLKEFVSQMEDCDVGEYVLTSVDRDGMMSGFDIELVDRFMNTTNKPVIAVAGGGDMTHYGELFTKTKVEAVGSASIFHFTQYTPMDIKKELLTHQVPVRI
ncbi:MAG: imidazole glycerol phosphate synthase subunit HisF [Sphingobacteriaceae bacterium]|nr:imidazole glycerol phosphate synthase subunit HisF [Sphingobacteriaceae bacterium]